MHFPQESHISSSMWIISLLALAVISSPGNISCKYNHVPGSTQGSYWNGKVGGQYGVRPKDRRSGAPTVLMALISFILLFFVIICPHYKESQRLAIGAVYKCERILYVGSRLSRACIRLMRPGALLPNLRYSFIDEETALWLNP